MWGTGRTCVRHEYLQHFISTIEGIKVLSIYIFAKIVPFLWEVPEAAWRLSPFLGYFIEYLQFVGGGSNSNIFEFKEYILLI